MAMGILDNMALLQSGFFLEEAPCGSTGFFTARALREFVCKTSFIGRFQQTRSEFAMDSNGCADHRMGDFV
jgi:hypothetical protein